MFPYEYFRFITVFIFNCMPQTEMHLACFCIYCICRGLHLFIRMKSSQTKVCLFWVEGCWAKFSLRFVSEHPSQTSGFPLQKHTLMQTLELVSSVNSGGIGQESKGVLCYQSIMNSGLYFPPPHSVAIYRSKNLL